MSPRYAEFARAVAESDALLGFIASLPDAVAWLEALVWPGDGGRTAAAATAPRDATLVVFPLGGAGTASGAATSVALRRAESVR